MIGAGITIAAASGLPSWLFGYPYLTSTFGYVPIPLIGPVEIASVIVFDIGVFFTVVGIVLISLANLARVEDKPAASGGAGTSEGTAVPPPPRNPAPQETS
jgi:multicomponent K+:H+ antiporter subunit A